MKKRFVSTLSASAALAFALTSVQVNAGQISGGISVAGDYRAVDSSLNLVGDLTTASWLLFGPTASIGNTVVTGTAGDFTSVPIGTVIGLTPQIAVNPPVPPVGTLLSAGGYAYGLNSVTEPSVETSTLKLFGAGIFTAPGFDPTPAQFIATMNTLGLSYSWSASLAAIPPPFSVSGVVNCPNGNTAAGIVVYITGVGSTTTSGNGAYSINLPGPGTYTVCIDPSTLPAGASVDGNLCSTFTVDNNVQFATVDFMLKGPFCEVTPPPGPCWLTGGGTVDKSKGVPDYSYGGVVNPGCSPTAAGGGNWNVVDHLHSLHFKGLDITVIDCSGVPTRSPKVTVNIIDFRGTGIITGVAGNPFPATVVTFRARAIDNSEPGSLKDALYLHVVDATTSQTLLLISDDPGNPANIAPKVITTGNLQIHQTSCN